MFSSKRFKTRVIDDIDPSINTARVGDSSNVVVGKTHHELVEFAYDLLIS